MGKKGYIVVNITVTDPEAYKEYPVRSRPYVARNGGRYLVGTNDIDEKEGNFGLNRLVIIEFPSADAARKADEAEEYQKDILPYRLRASESDLVIVEGFD
jgi:uncharacterized protein (DUF1330 family)